MKNSHHVSQLKLKSLLRVLAISNFVETVYALSFHALYYFLGHFMFNFLQITLLV